MSMRKALIRFGLETLYFSGTHRMLRPFLSGVGAILTLHHVRPARPDAFQPNRLLEVTPEFLESVVVALRRADVDLVSLDELHRRLVARDFGKPFVALTFDDGYRDNRDFAQQILRRHGVPWNLYVASAFAERRGELWWVTLERAVAASEQIAIRVDGEDRRFACATAQDKILAFEAIYWWLRSLPDEDVLRHEVRALALRAGVDADGICTELCMSWEELRALAADPAVTIAAHTVDHIMLRKAPPERARAEMEQSAVAITAALGRRPRHFSFPVGDATSAGPREFAFAKELGYATAVTTRPGVLYPEHAELLTSLPRISLNGEFQRLRYLDVLLSGAPSLIFNGFRRIAA